MKRQLLKQIVMCAVGLIIVGQFALAQTVSNLKTGGRIMNDWTWMSPDDDLKDVKGNLVDGTEFRRVRFFTSGTLHGNIDFKLQFDFTGGDADLKDAYIGLSTKCPLTGIPLYLKAGHFKEPYSLENLTSSKYITFIERSLPIAFAPSRNNGLQLSSASFNNRLTWAAGVFGEANDYGKGETEGGYTITARVTGLPMYTEDGEKLIHLGLSASSRNLNSTKSYSSMPEVHLGPKYVDTGSFAANSILMLDVEGAVVLGPLSVQAEVFSTSVESETAGDPSFLGYYGTVSFFITGEHRAYKTNAFDRVKPNANFGDGGIGALELAVRYSGLNLEDAKIAGGELSDITVGLNWHLNPHSRVMVNYIRADLKDAGIANILSTRLQVDF